MKTVMWLSSKFLDGENSDTGTSNGTVETVTDDDPFKRARKEVEDIYGSALTDANRQSIKAQRDVIELQRQLAELQATRTQQTDHQVDGATFLGDPASHTRRIIQEELKAALSDVNGVVSNMRQESAFTSMKRQFLADARLGPLYKQVEFQVDNMLAGVQPLDQNAFQAAILSAYGAAQAGLIPGLTLNSNTNQNQNQNQNGNRMSNQSLPSNAPTPPVKKPAVTKIELTESQRRVARIQGLTDDEYLAYLDSDGTSEDLNKISEGFKK